MAHYIYDDLNNRIEGLSKEEIYALIDEVIASGELPTEAQTAFVTALKSIVDGNPYKIGFCTTAEYNELEAQGELQEDALYIITDDSSYNDLINYIDNKILELKNNEIADLQDNVNKLISGEVVPKFATRLTQLEEIEHESASTYSFNLPNNGLYLIIVSPSSSNNYYTALLYTKPILGSQVNMATNLDYGNTNMYLYYTASKELILVVNGSYDLDATFKVYRLA